MQTIENFLQRDDVQRYWALLIIGLGLYVVHSQISIVLLTVIFSYLAISNANKLVKRFNWPYVLSIILIYVLIIVALVLSVRFIIPVLSVQFAAIPKEVDGFLREYPVIQKYADSAYHRFDVFSELSSNWRSILQSGLGTLGRVSHLATQLVLSIFLSFVLSLTWQRLKRFGHQFLHSDYPNLFKNIRDLGGTFISILGSVVEVQLKISFINTILMIIGMSFLKIPSVLVLGVMIFFLGLIPIAGVLISMVPLSLVALAAIGPIGMIELWILIGVIHAFESYFLHPRLMADRTELPVFVTFTTLIVMEHLIGGWGLIVGVPIVSFFLNFWHVQAASIDTSTKVVADTDAD